MEEGGIRAYCPPRIRPRRYPAKVMYLGVVACAQPRYNFDGTVCLHSVSRTKNLTRGSRNNRFSVDVDVVQSTVSGKWIQQLATGGMEVEIHLVPLKKQYELDEDVSNRLVIGYKAYTKQGRKKWKALSPTGDRQTWYEYRQRRCSGSDNKWMIWGCLYNRKQVILLLCRRRFQKLGSHCVLPSIGSL